MCCTCSAGEWKPRDGQFLVPRYVLCIPEDRVVVLDDNALHVFMSNGALIKKLLGGEAHSYRGLAYCNENETIIRLACVCAFSFARLNNCLITYSVR